MNLDHQKLADHYLNESKKFQTNTVHHQDLKRLSEYHARLVPQAHEKQSKNYKQEIGRIK